MIQLVGNDLQGRYILLLLAGAPELVVPNTTYPIDWKSFKSYLGLAPTLRLRSQVFHSKTLSQSLMVMYFVFLLAFGVFQMIFDFLLLKQISSTD